MIGQPTHSCCRPRQRGMAGSGSGAKTNVKSLTADFSPRERGPNAAQNTNKTSGSRHCWHQSLNRCVCIYIYILVYTLFQSVCVLVGCTFIDVYVHAHINISFYTRLARPRAIITVSSQPSVDVQLNRRQIFSRPRPPADNYIIIVVILFARSDLITRSPPTV